jgi:hypothetical protein
MTEPTTKTERTPYEAYWDGWDDACDANLRMGGTMSVTAHLVYLLIIAGLIAFGLWAAVSCQC